MRSGPIPSPAMTAIRNSIGYSIIGTNFERFPAVRAIPLHSADRGKGPERGARQDAPPPPGPPSLPIDLLGRLGLRRGRVPAAARRRRRRAGLGVGVPGRVGL